MGHKNCMRLQPHEDHSLVIVCYELCILLVASQLIFATTSALLNPPKKLSVNNVSTSSVRLTWERGSEYDKFYNVIYSEKYVNKFFQKRVYDTNVDLEGLKRNQEYIVVVEVVTTSGASVKSEYLEFQTRQFDDEIPVLELRVKSLNPRNITLVWDKPETNKNIKGYTIYYTSMLGLPIVLWDKKNLTQKNQTATIDGLDPETTYKFLILAYDADEQGPLSHPLTAVTGNIVPVAPPSNVRVVTIGSDMVTIGWDEPNVKTAIQGYKLFYTSRSELPIILWLIREYPGNQTTATVVGLISNETYNFAVLAYNDKGLGPLSTPLEVKIKPHAYDAEELGLLSHPPSQVIGRIDTSILFPPSNVRVVTIGSDMVTIGWDKPNGKTAIQGYKLLYTSTPELPIVLWVSIEYPGNQTTATVAGLISNEAYHFAVLAYNDESAGPVSRPIEVKTKPSAPRSPPSNLRVLRRGRDWVILGWDKLGVEDIIKGYKVYYTTRPELPFSAWNVELIPGQTETLTINDLVSTATYTFRVAAFNEGGEGPLSLALQTMMKQVRHDKPRRVTTVAINSTAIQVEWRPPRIKFFNGRVDRYHVYYEDLTKFTRIRHKVATEKTTMVITGLKPDTFYKIQVAGYTTSGGEGVISDPKTERTHGGVPSKPRNLSVSLIDSDLLVARVSWEPPQYLHGPLNSYKLYMGNEKEPYLTVLFDNDTLSYVTTHLDGGTLYHFRVHASNEIGYGEMAVSELKTPGNSGQPTVSINPRDPLVSEGENVTLQCVAKGKPSPRISWKEKNQDQLMFPSGNYGRFSVTEDGSLFIQDVKDSDAGIYVCDAHNSKGKSSASSVLKVKGSNAKAETMSPFQEKVLELLQRNVDANEKIAEDIAKTYEAVEKMAKSMNAQ